MSTPAVAGTGLQPSYFKTHSCWQSSSEGNPLEQWDRRNPAKQLSYYQVDTWGKHLPHTAL